MAEEKISGVLSLKEMAKEKKRKLKKRLKHYPNSRYFEIQDSIFKYFGLFCTFFCLLVLAVLIGDLLIDGLGRINWDFLMNPPSYKPEKSGIFIALMGTLWIMIGTALIALPIGISAGVYLEEYGKKSKIASFIEINISNLAGVPSIIYGLLGLEIFVRALNMGESILAGCCTLALLILPIIIVATREALRGVPYSIREASYALGATKWQTISNQVLPAAGGGILTGVILSISRAIGETAPLILVGVAAYLRYVPESPLDSYSVLPYQIFNWVNRPEEEFIGNATAAIIIMLLITFVMNGIAVLLRYKWQKKVKW